MKINLKELSEQVITLIKKYGDVSKDEDVSVFSKISEKIIISIHYLKFMYGLERHFNIKLDYVILLKMYFENSTVQELIDYLLEVFKRKNHGNY